MILPDRVTPMTHEEKINNMRIATNLCKFGFDYHHLDLLVSIYEAVLEKEGDLTLRDVSGIEHECKKRSEEKHKQDLIDKV